RLSSDDTVRCPSCGGADIRHSLPRGLLDWFMMAFGKAPFRCRRCERRFYRSVAVPAPAEPERPEKTAPVTLVQNSFYAPPFWTGEEARRPGSGGLRLSPKARKRPLLPLFEAFPAQRRLPIRFGQDRNDDGDLLRGCHGAVFKMKGLPCPKRRILGCLGQ